MIALYDFTLSGNCYKVRLMLALLGLEYKAIPVKLKEGEQGKRNFKRHPFGKVPVLVDNDTVIWDSQAILVYLAHQYGDEDCQATQNQWARLCNGYRLRLLIAESFAVARRHLTKTPVDIDAQRRHTSC